MSKRIDERHSRILASLLKLSENKKCFDCSSKVNVYANLFNSTFICERCSGLHRELNHRVKSISASTFTPDEIAALQKGGNGVAKTIWLATWSWQEYPEPDSNDNDEVRQFMRAKYIKKLWHMDGGNTTTQPDSSKDSTPRPSTASSAPRPSNVSSSYSPQHHPSSSPSSSSAPRTAVSTNPNVASAKAAGTAFAGSMMIPSEQRTLSRKSSTLSTDSGSTNLSKSTDPSSAGSSPFNPASVQSAHNKLQQQATSHQQFPSSNLGQYSFSQFQQTLASSANHHASLDNNNAVTADNEDPFSLMQASFSNMQVSSSHPHPQPSVPARSHTAPTPSSTNNSYGSFADFESAFSVPSRQPPVPSMPSSSNDFFATFQGSSTASPTASIPRGPPSNLATSSAFGTAFQGHGALLSSPSMVASPGSVSPMPQNQHSSQPSLNDYFSSAGSGMGHHHPNYNSSTLGVSSGAKSFDDFLSSIGPSSPAPADVSNPFGLQSTVNTTTTLPPAIQRAHTSAYPSSNSAGGSTNPFAAFAKTSTTSPALGHSNDLDLQDPFGHLSRAASASSSSVFLSNGGGHSTPTPFGAASPSSNPFGAPSASSMSMSDYPFGIPASQPPATSLSSSPFYGTSSTPSAAMPSLLSRATTEPNVSHFATAPSPSSSSSKQADDVFGTWAAKASGSPSSSTAAASSRAFGLNDFDPFGRHTATQQTQQPISTNPFGL